MSPKSAGSNCASRKGWSGKWGKRPGHPEGQGALPSPTHIFTSQDFSWLQKGQVNWVSRVPVIFFLGGGFRFDFLRPMAAGGQSVMEGRAEVRGSGSPAAFQFVALGNGPERRSGSGLGEGKTCTMVPSALPLGNKALGPQAGRQSPHTLGRKGESRLKP